MKRFYLLITNILFCSLLFGQQIPHFSLDMLNTFNLNPAYAGLEQSLNIKAGVRSQWVSFPGSPKTQYVSADMPLYILLGGIGIQVENETIGAEQGVKGLISYNYQTYLGNGIISFGVAGGILSRSLDGSKLLTPQGNYNEPGMFTHNDDILPTTQINLSIPLLNAGIYYKTEKIEGGISMFNINAGNNSQNGVSLQLTRHFLMNVATHFELNNTFSISPSFVLRSDLVETQTTLSVLLNYGESAFGGVSIRGYNAKTLDALALIGGFKLNEKMNLAYAYDIGLSQLRRFHNGSHEIQLSYRLRTNFGKGRLPKIIYNPRFL